MLETWKLKSFNKRIKFRRKKTLRGKQNIPSLYILLIIYLLGFRGWCLGRLPSDSTWSLRQCILFFDHTYNDIRITYQYTMYYIWCIWSYIHVVIFIVIYSVFILTESSSRSQSTPDHYFSLEASYLTCFLRPDYPLTGIFELK